jgi:hypothetical protein
MRPLPSTALFIVLALGYVYATDTAADVAQESAAPIVQLPNDASSFKFAVLGNSGTGEKAQYEVAEQMAALRERFDFRTVLLLGGNIHGNERPQDFVRKFESPYRRLLDQGVAFRAVLGNDDSREQRFYKLFNMTGEYYTFSPVPGVQFFALETTYVTPTEMQWLEDQLKRSSSDWRIAFFHHSLYSSARRHGSHENLRNMLEPLFLKYNVSVAFSASDNVYERITPQKEITYFVVGSGGAVRRGDLDPKSGFTAAGFDTDLAFLAAEIAGDTMTFNVISRAGQTVDSGRVMRRK